MLARNLTLLCTSLLVFWIGAAEPMYNWDIIGYVASAYHADGYSGAKLRDLTYADIRKEVDAHRYSEVTANNSYDGVVFHNPVALEQHLPMYSIRVTYVEGMRALKSFGVEYPRGTYLIAAFFGALSVLMFGAVVSTAGMPVLIVPLVVVATGLGNLARLSTPDTLACFFSLWAMYCLLTRSRLLFVASALLPFMRTDAVVLSALLMAFAFWRGQRVLSVASFAVSAAAYVLINRIHGNYGWLMLINQSLIQKSPFPGSIVPSHDLGDYVRAYFLTFQDIVTQPNFLTPIVLVAVYVYALHRRAAGSDLSRYAFFFIPLAFAVLRLLLYPSYEDRYFCFSAMMILAGTLATMSGLQDERD
jgi:hypothetical protein